MRLPARMRRVRGDSIAGPGLLLLFGLLALALALGAWTQPSALARRNFPFNWIRDDSSPRRAFVAAPLVAMGIVLIVLGLTAL